MARIVDFLSSHLARALTARELRALEETQTLELKVSAVPGPSKQLRRAFGEGVNRSVTFFDIPEKGDYRLYQQGIIVRARVSDAGGDLAVKVRSKDPKRVADLGDGWDALTKGPHNPGAQRFKSEPDVVLNGEPVFGAQVTVRAEPEEIARVAAGERGVKRAVTEDQRRLLEELGYGPVKFARLRPLGSVDSTVWQLTPPNMPKVTVECWKLPDGNTLLEFSTKDTPENAAKTLKRLRKLVKRTGFEVAEEPRLKTGSAFEAFRAASGKSAAG